MSMLLAGLVIFFAVHLLPVKQSLRASLVGKLGVLPYKALFAIVSLIGFYFIVVGKAGAPFISIWTPPDFFRHITILLVLIAFLILPAAYIPSNIKNRLKNPMLIAVKIWALGHLLANGDLASMVLFGSFLAYAVVDMISVKKRALPPIGKQPIWRDIVVVVIGLVAYLVIMMKHASLFGVPVITVAS